MSDSWHVVRDGKRFGPYSTAQLRALAAAGRLRPTDSIWKEGMVRAVLVTKVKNLFPVPQPQPRPPEAVSAQAAPAALSPTPTVSPSAVLAVEPPPAPPEEVPETADKNAPADSPALAANATQPAEHKADAKAAVPSRPMLRRALSMKGGILLSQDGYRAHYRKKCSLCGFEDASRSTMLIGIGTTRAHFFCPKCRKNREVQLQGCIQ